MPRSKPPAAVAAPPPPSDPPAELVMPELGPRRLWPKYTEEEQALLATFLGAMRADAIDALQKVMQLRELSPTLPGLIEHAAYWKHLAGGIDWMTSRLSHRQKHLRLIQLLREQLNPGS